MDGYGGWYEDFWSLSTERQIGFGLGPIPASHIDRCSIGWAYDDVECFEFCIREMDKVYLMHENKPDQEAPPTTGSARDAFREATAGRRGK